MSLVNHWNRFFVWTRAERAAVARAALVALLLVQPMVWTAQAQKASAVTRPSSSGVSWVQESWTVKDGLPVNSFNAILQDRAGYIWAATFDGLVRFDGLRFTIFNSANSEQLPSNRIVQLKEALDGSLWLATEQAHIVRLRGGRFSNILFDSSKPQTAAVLFLDSAGGVWVGTTDGLWKVNGDRLVRIGRGTLDARVTFITQRRDSSLWVGTSGAGIFRVTSDNRVTRVIAGSALDTDLVGHMLEDSSGTLWIASTRSLWSWRDRLLKVKGSQPSFPMATLTYVRRTGAVYAQIVSARYRIDSDSAVLAHPSFLSDGFGLLTERGATWNVVGRNVLRDDRLVLTLPESLVVTASLFDREGSLWLGTDSRGLFRFKPALFTTYSTPEGVAYSNVYSTYVGRSGAVWLGTWGKGASRLDPVTGRASAFSAGTAPTVVNSFYEDDAGTLWIAGGQSYGGVYVCAPPGMTCRADGPRDLRDRPVYALYVCGC